MIMGQARRAVARLTPQQQAQITVVAVTLDPEHDDPPALRKLADKQGVSTPRFNLVTGDPKVVHRLLDDMEIQRTRNPETGVIEHANIFLLVDRQGRVAYRLSLGEIQERWMGDALKILCSEPHADQ